MAVVSRVAVDHESPEEVVAIRVSGRGLGYQTGAGLRLGDSLGEGDCSLWAARLNEATIVPAR